MPLPFPDFSLWPASWILSCCVSALTSSSPSISWCHQYTSLDFQCIVLCYWFQLVWSSDTPPDHQHTHDTQYCVFYIYCPEERYRMKRIGPRTNPCGTPYDSVTGSDSAWALSVLITTFWDLSVRYLCSQFNTVPSTTNLYFSLFKSREWLTIPNVALTSNRTRHTTFLLSMALWKSILFFNNMVSVECPFL